MKQIAIKQKSDKGVALVLALTVVLVVGLAATYFYKRYEANKEVQRQDNLKKALTIKAMDNIENVKGVLRKVVFALNARNEANNVIPVFNFQTGADYWRRLLVNRESIDSTMGPNSGNIRYRLNGQTWTGVGSPTPVPTYAKSDREIVSVTCVQNCNNDPLSTPKLFDLQYVLRSDDTGSAVQVKVQIALEPPSINNIAYLVRSQPATSPLVISSLTDVRGKFAVFFDNPTLEASYSTTDVVNGQSVYNSWTEPVAEVRFRNSQKLTFYNEFQTNASQASIRYGQFGYNRFNQAQAASNAEVEFKKGAAFGAPDPTGQMLLGFQNLRHAGTTDSWNDSYAGYPGRLVMELGRASDGTWIMNLYKETNAPITIQTCVSDKNSTGDFVDSPNSDLTDEKNVVDVPPSTDSKISTDTKLTTNAKTTDTSIRDGLYTESRTKTSGSGCTTASTSQCTGSTCKTYIAQNASINTARTQYVNATTDLVVKALPGQSVIQNGNAPITVMTDRTMILEAPVTKVSGQSSSQGNLALVSLDSNVRVSETAASLLPGNPTLSTIATSGLPSGLTPGTPTFQIDAAVVTLNGSLTMPFVECPSGSNCPRPLGELAVNGALMQKKFAPMNAVNTDTNQIVSGVTKLSLNFNDGFMRPGGVMPGFSQADVSSLNASLVGAVEVNFVERGMAELWFGMNPTTTVASNTQTSNTNTTNVTTVTGAQ